ncbi:unnamed protein product [Brassica rapa]|uniref:Uncharacterized protein n=1 Tax=Brassica campestris TaxID=3711 RepID=A0A8D9HWJ5_BRACM|nr:unnamed protein product [Brassica rapa]
MGTHTRFKEFTPINEGRYISPDYSLESTRSLSVATPILAHLHNAAYIEETSSNLAYKETNNKSSSCGPKSSI